MKKFLFAALLTAFGFFAATTANAQSADGPRDFGFAFAVDYNKWMLHSAGDIASGAQVVTIKEGNVDMATSDGRSFRPLSTTAPLLIDAGSANAETVTPSAVTCAQGALTCSFSATFGNAHSGFFSIQSGTYGLAEAKNAILARAAGGTVLVANGFAGTSSNITSGWNGTSTVNVLDVRSGGFQFYTSSGATYSASLSPFNNTTAAHASVTAATGAAFFYDALNQGTNHGMANLALGANTNASTYDFLKTRTTNADGRATTAITTGDDIGAIRAWSADGTNFIESAQILFDSTGTIAATRAAGQIKFLTATDAAPSVLTQALLIDKDQTATFAAQVNVPTLNNTSAALALKTTTSGNITLTPATAATAAVNVVGSRFGMAQGANIDSAGASCVTGDCTLGGDGNFFTITNTTSVDGFATGGWQTGSIIIVKTTGSITFNNNGTVAGGYAPLLLVGGANVSMTANDLMMLVYNSSIPAWEQVAPTLVK